MKESEKQEDKEEAKVIVLRTHNSVSKGVTVK